MIHIAITLVVFTLMEGLAWATHKYVMHGFLWSWHKDHHQKNHNSIFEKNDRFFIFYALVSISCIAAWNYGDFEYGLAIGLGIFMYGFTYFMIHDVFIHRRLRWFSKTESVYGKAIRKAHKIHHKHLGKEDGECFGLLWVPSKYYNDYKDRSKSK
jgi:beta-carotene 3-hydroxylase